MIGWMKSVIFVREVELCVCLCFYSKPVLYARVLSVLFLCVTVCVCVCVSVSSSYLFDYDSLTSYLCKVNRERSSALRFRSACRTTRAHPD